MEGCVSGGGSVRGSGFGVCVCERERERESAGALLALDSGSTLRRWQLRVPQRLIGQLLRMVMKTGTLCAHAYDCRRICKPHVRVEGERPRAVDVHPEHSCCASRK